MNKKVTSREYKLMLSTDRFQDREEGIKSFWDLVSCILKKTNHVHEVKTQSPKEPFKERRTWYMDTPGKDFNASGWVLRKREEEKKGRKKYKTTLKYRSPDRFISASKDLSANAKNSETKFEEDLVAVFSSKYSHSTSIETYKDDPIKDFGDVAKLFPGIKDLDQPDDIKMCKVNDFTARELVYHVGNFTVGDDKIRVNSCLSFWYLTGKGDMYPLAAEFSFDYDRHKKAGFPVDACMAAKLIFSTLQKQRGWVDLGGTTKSAFAYTGF